MLYLSASTLELILLLARGKGFIPEALDETTRDQPTEDLLQFCTPMDLLAAECMSPRFFIPFQNSRIYPPHSFPKGGHQDTV